MSDVEDKRVQRIAIVTGAGSGLGKAASQKLATDGMHVICIDRSGRAEAVVDALVADGLSAEAHIVDVSDVGRAEQFIEDTADRHGRIDVLINNAGYGINRDHRPAKLEEVTIDEWNGILGVNLTAPFILSRAAIPHMRRNGWGRIVNVSSRAGRTGVPAAEVAYSSTKAGLLGLTRYLAMVTAADGITVNTIAPGRFDTPLASDVAPEVLAQSMANIPTKRVGDPAEFAATVSFMVSEEAGYMTGATIDVNGGAFMG